MSDNDIEIKFETFIPPYALPNGQEIPYRINEQPFFRDQMMQKIEKGIIQFGSIEKFIEVFNNELQEKKGAAEYAVRSYEMRRLQMEFLTDHYLNNCTPKMEGLDPK